MNSDQAKALSIVDYLASAGFRPEKVANGQAWYRSPLRDEDTASFKVNIARNIWYDHGGVASVALGKKPGGDLLELVQQMYRVGASEALRILGGMPASDFSLQLPKGLPTAQASGVQITRIVPLKHWALLNYCTSRGIPHDVAVDNLHEAYFLVKGKKEQFALAFGNDSGGYEIRNKLFQSCAGKKDVTLVRAGDANVVSVFEGFFDYLSALVLSKKPRPSHHVLVLNSLALLPRALPHLNNYKQINLYLDNDSPGEEATIAILSQFPGATDKSSTYHGYDDLNDYLTSPKRTCTTT
jgi:hypothetical protein